MYRVNVFTLPDGLLVAMLDEPKPRFTVWAPTQEELESKVRAAFTRMIEHEKGTLTSLDIIHKDYPQPPTGALYLEASVQ